MAIDLFTTEGCASCRLALDVLQLTGLPIRARDLFADPLSWDEIKRLAALAGGLRHIICTRARGYRLNGLARPDVPEPEMLRLMAADPDLIRRPIVMVGGTVLVGFEGTHAERTLVGPRT